MMTTPEELKAAEGSSTMGVLAASALNDLKARLASFGSSLSDDAHIAIAALLTTLEAGLSGRNAPLFYLSSIDPGTGKTLAVSLFLKAWKANGFTPASSILIGVSRREEITTYLEASGLEQHDVAVLTDPKAKDADGKAYSRLGLPDDQHGEARVMFTTQQMIQRRCRGRTFAEVPAFHYQGRPRVLRVWDESILLDDPLTVRVDDLGLLASPLRRTALPFVQAVQSFQRSLWDLKPGEALTIPQDLERLAPTVSKRGNVAGIIEMLERLAGQSAQMVDTGMGDMRLAGVAPSIPEDFAPAVVIDASGRVRETYTLWEEQRGSLHRLPAAANDYRNLEVNIWQRSSGKAAFDTPAERKIVVEAMAAVINEDADSEWLIVRFKDSEAIFSDLKKRVEHNADRRLRSLTWGMHHGTNAYADVSNVILVGQLNYGQADYIARFAAASGRPMEELDGPSASAIQWGEYQHNLLQALCRSAVRRSKNGVAGSARAYVITTPATGLEERVRSTFPGCRIEQWRPVHKPLSGQALAVADYLEQRFASQACHSVSRVEVYKALGIEKANFTRLLKHPGLRSHLYNKAISVRGYEEPEDAKRAVADMFVKVRFQPIDAALSRP